jgi:hypothetical protein
MLELFDKSITAIANTYQQEFGIRVCQAKILEDIN